MAAGALWLAVLGCGGRLEKESFITRANAGQSSGAVAGAPAAGGTPPSGGAAGSGGAPQNGFAGRVPEHHRASGPVACPSERNGDGGEANACSYQTCSSDADCTDGVNGRCQWTGVGCTTSCTYDTCTSDADCADNKPCECRPTGASAIANRCETASNCRVDSDCGPAGFCSPSLVGTRCTCLSADFCGPDTSCSTGSCVCGDSCGHGYFCHTPADECLDDGDCPAGSACDFDLPHQRFICTGCLLPP